MSSPGSGPESVRVIESLIESHTNALRSLQNSIGCPTSETNPSTVSDSALTDATVQDESLPGISFDAAARRYPLFNHRRFTSLETSQYFREEKSEFPPLSFAWHGSTHTSTSLESRIRSLTKKVWDDGQDDTFQGGSRIDVHES